MNRNTQVISNTAYAYNLNLKTLENSIKGDTELELIDYLNNRFEAIEELEASGNISKVADLRLEINIIEHELLKRI
jgi:hypothetical protein